MTGKYRTVETCFVLRGEHRSRHHCKCPRRKYNRDYKDVCMNYSDCVLKLLNFDESIFDGDYLWHVSEEMS
jgi:hypothetical protein